MGKKVKVTTKCGEEFFYDHNQEVETVEVVEDQPQFRKMNLYKKIQELMDEICHDGMCTVSHDKLCPLNLDGTTCLAITYRNTAGYSEDSE